MMMTKKPSNSRALWKYLAALPLCFLLVFAFANREGGTGFSPFSFVSDNFNPDEIKSELSKIVSIRNIAFEEDRRQIACEELFERFDELMMEYPAHRNEIKMIAEDVTNEKGIEIAIVREENSKDFYSIVSLESWNRETIYKDPIYKEVDEMPRFPGCEEKSIEEREDCAQYEMLMFIYKNIKYPQEARDNNIQGTVVTRFVVGANGKIRDAKIVREIGGGCDEAVLEIVAQMPDWIPGKKDGKNVAVEYNLPVKFKLEEKKKEEVKEEKRPEECFVQGLELKDLSIAPNPSTGTFRVKFSAEKKPLIVVVSDMYENFFYAKEIKDFSGFFDEEITIETAATAVNVLIMQGDLLHTSRVAIVK